MALAIGQSAKASNFGTSLTTGAITTAASGSSFLVWQSYDNSTGSSSYSSFVDSKSNVYLPVGTEQQADISSQWTRLWYCALGTGGAGHTWTSGLSVSRSNNLRAVEITTGGLGTVIDNTAVQVGINTSDPFSTPNYSTASATTLLLAGLNSTTSVSGATHTWDTSLTNLSAVEDTDGTTSIVGAVGYRALSALFGPASVTCTEVNRAGRGAMFMLALREALASTLIGPRMMTGMGK